MKLKNMLKETLHIQNASEVLKELEYWALDKAAAAQVGGHATVAVRFHNMALILRDERETP